MYSMRVEGECREAHEVERRRMERSGEVGLGDSRSNRYGRFDTRPSIDRGRQIARWAIEMYALLDHGRLFLSPREKFASLPDIEADPTVPTASLPDVCHSRVALDRVADPKLVRGVGELELAADPHAFGETRGGWGMMRGHLGAVRSEGRGGAQCGREEDERVAFRQGVSVIAA